MKFSTGLVLFCVTVLVVLRLRYNSGVEGEFERMRTQLNERTQMLTRKLEEAVEKQEQLQKQLENERRESAKRSLVEQQRQQPATREKWVPANSSAEAAHAEIEGNYLLTLHRRWDWQALAKELLFPFEEINEKMLKAAVGTCYDNGTMYCQRMQVKNGKLYLQDYRAIFFDRHYAPARIMPMLEVMRRHKLPDLDIVVAAVDEPRVKMKIGSFNWAQTVGRYNGANGKLPPPLFSSTINRGCADLPWADFSFYMPRKSHKLRTPPWSVLQPKMLRESAGVPWESKIELAMHTGNVGSPYRKRLAAQAQKSPETMLVNELFIGDHGKITKTCHQLGKERQGGYQKHLCYMTFTEQCSYKYLVNSASIGYANKFKYLLLCGSVVIYVNEGMQHKEFYEYGLLPGVHYVTVDTAADVPAMVRYLQTHDSYARGVAAAGRARISTLDNDEIAKFYAELFRQYAKLQRFQVKVDPGAVEMNCEDDLWRHYARDRFWMRHYLSEDNGTCIHPPESGARLSAPGWGGAYAGSKVRCSAAHDRLPRAQPHACDEYQPGTSFKPFDQFPAAHPKDPTHWDTDGTGTDNTP